MADSKLVFDLVARDNMSKTFDKVGKNAGTMQIAVGAAMGTMAKDAISSALGYGKELFNLGGQLEQMGIKADTVFGGQVGVVENWAKQNAAAMGLTRRETVGLATNMADLLIPMGFTQKAAAEMSTKTVGLSGALSQWSGGTISAAGASEILSKAMLGERDGLKSLGISISEADVQAQLLKNGQDKLTGSALEQAKALATQELIFAKSTDAQKAYAEGGAPMLSMQAKATAMFGEAKEVIATNLVPAVMGLVGAVGTATAFIGDNATAFKAAAIVVGVLAAATAAHTLVVAANSGAITAWLAKTTLAKVATAAWTTVQAGLNLVMSLNPIMLVVLAIGALVAIVITAYKNSETFRSIVDRAFRVVREGAAALWSGVQTAFGSIIRKMTEVRNWISTKAGEVVEFFTALPKKITTGVGDLFKPIKDKATEMWEWIDEKVEAIVKFFTDLPGKIIDSVRGQFGGMFDGIWEAFKAVVNRLIRGWNSLSFGISIPSVHVPGTNLNIGGLERSFRVPQIPQLATGGTAIAPGLALVGERGPELLAMNKGASVIPLAGHAAGGTVINLTLNVAPGNGANGKLIAEEVVAALQEYTRHNGSLHGVRVAS